MLTLLIILKLMGLGWFLTRFPLIEMILESMPENLFFMTLRKLNCMKCYSFWIGLIMTHNIYIAILAAFCSMLYENSIGKWELRINPKELRNKMKNK